MATQQERRSSAIARLLDASIDTIVELGYAKASAAAITSRAGLSHGALFRHFETMSDFMAATAAEVLGRQLADFESRIAAIGLREMDVPGVLAVLRAVMGSRANAVIYELTNAARTDDELKRILQAGSAGYLEKVTAVASLLPGFEAMPAELLPTLVLMLTDVFDAEAMLQAVRPLPADELERRDQVFGLLYLWATHLAPAPVPPDPPLTKENP